jgi:phage-related protein
VQFRVTFYRRATSTEIQDADIPMLTFLRELRRTQPTLEKLLVAGFRKLSQSELHGFPLTRPIQGEENLYELRVGGTNIARAFFFFRPDREIIVTHGYVKKQEKADRTEIQRAIHYKRDWEERYP